MRNLKKLLLFLVIGILLGFTPLIHLISDAKANTFCQSQGLESCDSSSPNDFVRVCADQVCSCTYTIVAWCDSNNCISNNAPPKDKIPNFQGYGKQEKDCHLSPKQCVPVAQSGACTAKTTTGGGAAGGAGTGGTNPALDKVFGSVNAPGELSALFGSTDPEAGITSVLSKIVELIYILAALIFVFYLLYSGLQFIYSEGNKESVAEARRRITWGIIGIVFLALAFVLLRLLGIITGFKFFGS